MVRFLRPHLIRYKLVLHYIMENTYENYIADYLFRCSHPRAVIVKLLIKEGYSVNSGIKVSGKSVPPLYFASENRKIIKVLLHNGADPGYAKPKNLNVVCSKNDCLTRVISGRNDNPVCYGEPSIIMNGDYNQNRRNNEPSVIMNGSYNSSHSESISIMNGVNNRVYYGTDASQFIGAGSGGLIHNPYSTLFSGGNKTDTSKIIRWYQNRRWSDFFTVL